MRHPTDNLLIEAQMQSEVEMNLRRAAIRLAHSNPNLRPLLLPILTANSWVTVKGGARAKYLDSIWKMYQDTYRAIGMHATTPSKLLEYDVWELSFGDDGSPNAFSMFETTSFGLKSTLMGHDGTPSGKAQALNQLRSKFLRRGVYGEASHKVKDIALAAGAPVVCAAHVGRILGKKIEPEADGVAYTRTLSGVGVVKKVLVGSPRGVPVTDAAHPSCPTWSPDITASFDEAPDTDVSAHYACLIF